MVVVPIVAALPSLNRTMIPIDAPVDMVGTITLVLELKYYFNRIHSALLLVILSYEFALREFKIYQQLPDITNLPHKIYVKYSQIRL